MTIKDIYKKHISALLNLYSEGEAVAIANVIFEYYTGLSGAKMIISGNTMAAPKTLIQLDIALDRLLEYTPVQYITGETFFCGLRFMVNSSVLIPRPETEELADEIWNELKKNSEKKVIDIGTGSGCIPISISKKFPAVKITAVDISRSALETARANAFLHGVEVGFTEMDFLDETNYERLPGFDFIISNPPYIPAEEEKRLDKNVTLYEPQIALFVPDDDPLIFYKKIKSFADGHLNPQGKIFLEVHEGLAKKNRGNFFRGKL